MLIGTVCQPVQELVCPGTMESLGYVLLGSDMLGIHFNGPTKAILSEDYELIWICRVEVVILKYQLGHMRFGDFRENFLATDPIDYFSGHKLQGSVYDVIAVGRWLYTILNAQCLYQ